MKKRIIFLALVMVMIFTLLPMSAFSADAVAEGTCGENLTWTLYSGGTLTVSGTGAMTDYSNDSKAPWFNSRSSIKSVIIENSVTSIGDRAFYDCDGLTSVTIPDSVTSIGWYAFYGCSKIKVVNYDGNIESWLGIEFASSSSNPCDNGSNLYFNGELVTNAVIPDSVTSIGSYTFYGCSSLTSVTIGNSVTSIGNSAFSGCSSLTSVTIPHGVTSIGGAAFCECRSLTSVTIPNSVTSIGEDAFRSCSSLASVTIPDSVTSIGDWAFRWCSSLTRVTIGNGVTSIGEQAFYDCSSLTSVTIPHGVTSIGDGAFWLCSKLNDIAFAGSKDAWASIKKGNEAFSTSPRIHYNCTTLDGHIIPMERKDPSCTSTGYIKYSCACGYEFTERLPENHDYVFIKSVAATCSNAGYDVYKCSKCGKILNKSNGEEQLPHEYELTKAVEPTCTEHGYDVYKCTVCGTSKTETRNDELLPHDYVVTVVEPTCLKGGYTLHKCSVCGDEYKDNLTAFLGHSMVEVGEKPATCNEAGHTAGVQCSRCGLVESGVTEIPALGHSFGEWTVTTAPTCTEKGVETRYCSRCDATETREVNALGHDLVHHDGKAATCTEAGWEAYDTCSRCDYTTYKEIPATGHSYTSVVTEPTCTEQGYTTHTCACGDSYVDSYMDALGHSFGEWTVTTAPTCTEKGVETRYCSRCDATETREVDALSHALVHHDSKAATCTEAGWKAYDTCSRCDYTTYKEIPATGHSYTSVVTEPTCTEQGYTTHTCACGDSYVDSYVDALGHSFGEWTVTTAPTCTEKGVETRYCSRCDATETREVDALGHDYKDGVCTVCGAKDPDYKPPVKENPFVDVAEDAVYYDAVLWAYYHEPEQITGGYTATEFRPGNPCTRGQVVTFLWRAAGCPDPTGDTSMFNDASSIAAPYQKAVAWAVEKGITTGFADGTFRPNDSVTRAQFVTFLWRYEGKPATSGSIAGFTDASSIAEPYQQAVAWAVEKGITTGYNDGSFRPNATCTRWAVVLFMYRDMA